MFKEIMAKIFQNVIKDMNMNIQGAQQTPSRRNSRDPHQDIL